MRDILSFSKTARARDMCEHAVVVPWRISAESKMANHHYFDLLVVGALAILSEPVVVCFNSTEDESLCHEYFASFNTNTSLDISANCDGKRAPDAKR